MNNQQKQQEELRLFKHYIQGLNEIKKDLEKIKAITNLEEKYNKANIALSGHYTKFGLASGHYNTGKLWEISGCNQSLNEYAQLVNELRNIETETFKQLKATQCAYCQKRNLTNPHVYETNSVTGVKTVFCDSGCLNKHLEKLKKLNGKQQANKQRERERESNSSKITCTNCNQTFQGKYWHAYDERKNLTYKYCSQECCDIHLLKKNQIISAHNRLVLERKNLKSPNFTYEELEVAQARGELENYVQQKIEEIRQNRENLNQQEQNNCPQCHQPLNGEWVWFEDKANDNLEFCSEECCDNYYGKQNPPQTLKNNQKSQETCPKCNQGLTMEKIYYDSECNKYFCSKICADLWTCRQAIEKIKTEIKKRKSDGLPITPNLKPAVSDEVNSPSTEQQNKNNTSLLLYIFCGIAGVGVISLVTFLIVRTRQKEC
ncbi:MAG: hypothetical protein MRECE_2c114 [Mycoplasmataceae bacterium CE_OT135]|nr:MAG: hypothetical protein MRECE_2c114 [Mycoplasmataceae bacterium CE_OT135]